MKPPVLSVVLITYNAAQDLVRCLESVKWADEIIVFDSGSTDETLTIARRYTTHIFSTDWPGFGLQTMRQGEHCFPQCPPCLIGGKRIRYGDWSKDWVVRLFPNDPQIQFTPATVHERLIGYTQVQRLKSPLFHYTVKNLEKMIDKLNPYSSLGAQSARQ